MSNNIKWLVEDVSVTTDTDRLCLALDETDTHYVITTIEEEREYVPNESFPTVAYGSLKFIDWIRKNTPYIPGSWVDFEALKCHRYLSYLSEFSIHKRFAFFTIGNVLRKTSAVFDLLSKDGKVFIKPNESRKSFSGIVVQYEEFQEFASQVLHLPEDELCLVSEPTDGIEKEWRLSFTHKGLVTGSQYQPEISSTLDHNAILLASKVAKEFYVNASLRIPYDHPVMIDIGKVGDEYFLIEIGGFNCAGLYDCNYHSLVNTLNECAQNEFNSYQFGSSLSK